MKINESWADARCQELIEQGMSPEEAVEQSIIDFLKHIEGYKEARADMEIADE